MKNIFWNSKFVKFLNCLFRIFAIFILTYFIKLFKFFAIVQAENLDSTSYYSEDEQDTGKKSLDGKIIYRKTFTGTITAAEGVRAFTTLASGIESIKNIEGWFMNQDGNKLQLGSVHTGNNPNTQIYGLSYVFANANKNMEVITWCAGDRTNAPYEYTAEYTKADE